MTLLYADTSAIVGAYLDDEDSHTAVATALRNGADPVITSEVTRIELTSAVTAAVRAGRLADAAPILARFDADCADGPIALARFEPETVIPLARELVRDHPVRTLDAIHLAVLMTTGATIAAGEPVVLVSRDQRQSETARALGIPTL